MNSTADFPKTSQITSILKIHLRNKVFWFLPLSLVVSSSFAINLVISFLIGGGTSIYSGGLASVFIYLFIASLITPGDTFSFALGFGARRTDYFLGTVCMMIVVSAIIAVPLVFCAFVENSLTGGWGLGLHFFHLPYLNDGSLIEQCWIDFVGLMSLSVLGFAIGCVYLRFSGKGMWILFISLFLLILVCTLLLTYYGRWLDFFHWLGNHSAFEYASGIVPLIVVTLFLSYILLRKATV